MTRHLTFFTQFLFLRTCLLEYLLLDLLFFVCILFGLEPLGMPSLEEVIDTCRM